MLDFQQRLLASERKLYVCSGLNCAQANTNNMFGIKIHARNRVTGNQAVESKKREDLNHGRRTDHSDYIPVTPRDSKRFDSLPKEATTPQDVKQRVAATHHIQPRKDGKCHGHRCLLWSVVCTTSLCRTKYLFLVTY